jgi:hypothetical protein
MPPHRVGVLIAASNKRARKGRPIMKTQARAADQTTVTFSCSKQLKKQIQQAADAERRSVSNWIVCTLEDGMQAKPSKK